jgi:gluconolactonase
VATEICGGLLFPEGPVWHPDGFLLVTEIIGQRISRVAGDRFEVLARTGGGANGMTLGPDGALYVTNNGGIALDWAAPDAIQGRIQRVTLDGDVTDVVVADLGSPNDCCFGPDGLLYFTDPRWEHGKEIHTAGRIYRTSLDGDLELLAEGPLFTNGLAFSGDTLLVAATYEQRILAYPWSASGLSVPTEFCRLQHGFPDGLCLDDAGRIYVAATIGRGIEVFEPDGSFVELLPIGDDTLPTNCCFGPDGTLYVTDSGGGRVFELR